MLGVDCLGGWLPAVQLPLYHVYHRVTEGYISVDGEVEEL